MKFKVIEPTHTGVSKHRAKGTFKGKRPEEKVFIEHYGNNIYGVRIDDVVYYIANDNIDCMKPKDGKLILYPSAMNDKYNEKNCDVYNKSKHVLKLSSYLAKTDAKKVMLNAMWKPFYTGQRILLYTLTKDNKLKILKLSKR